MGWDWRGRGLFRGDLRGTGVKAICVSPEKLYAELTRQYCQRNPRPEWNKRGG